MADAAASARWYEAKLGFETYRRMDLPEQGLQIVFLRSGSFRLELVEKAGAVPLTKLVPGLTDDMNVLGLKKRLDAYGRIVAGPVIAEQGKVVRPSQLIASVGPT